MTEKTPKIVILLATYNGSDFIDRQLTSLIEQFGVQIEIHVNDDGSTDGTLEQLEYWRQRGWIHSLTHSERIGSTRAFLYLLSEVNGQNPVAFCDQDDVWERDKLITLVNSLNNEKPMLVFSRRKYIDSRDKVIGNSKNPSFEPSFLNAMVENIVPGNSMMLNPKAIALINRYKDPLVTHYDSWIYLLLSALGECKFVSRDLVQYRIHEHNHVGLRKYGYKEFMKSVIHFGQQVNYFHKTVKVELPKESSQELIGLASIFSTGTFWKKLNNLSKLKIKRQLFRDRIAFRIFILLGVLTKKFK